MATDELFPSDDVKFKNFSSQVDKSLKGFEYSTEWADLISALCRLIKVIQSNAKTNHVPRSFLVGKRLAQCLHPALPPGVHCKALECYDIIFRTIGRDKLSSDLPIYGAGLFTLLGPSAMTVKPPLFDIYEQHLLPLGNALNPAFMGLLQGLLPGLEQGAEFSDRGTKTVEMFCATIGPKFFYTCLWKLLIHAPSVRYFGISFVINHFSKRKSIAEQDYVYGTNRKMLLRSLSCLFGDSLILVQRDALDFLQMALPIHFHSSPTTIVADGPLTTTETVQLCRAALSVLLRRDASLNRRLFTWLRGGQFVEGVYANDLASATTSNTSSSSSATTLAFTVLHESPELAAMQDRPGEQGLFVQDLYFKQYSLHILLEAVRQIIRSPSQMPVQNQLMEMWNAGAISLKSTVVNLALERGISERPFRIIAGLLDRCDLAGSVIQHLLPDLLWYTYNTFHVLKQRTTAWLKADSTVIIQPDLVSNFGPLGGVPGEKSCSRGVDNAVVSLIMDYVSSKDTTRLFSLREDIQKTTQFLENADGDVVPDVPVESSKTNRINQHHSISPPTDTKVSGPLIPTRLCAADEFMRTAHLFLSNLDGAFLWGLIESQLTELLTSDSLPSRSGPSITTHHSAVRLSLEDWCRVLRFLLTHLPIDIYPNVRGYHLPKLAVEIMHSLTERIRLHCPKSGNGMSSLTRDEVASVLQTLDALIQHIIQHVLTMFDHSTTFALGANSPSVRAKQPQQPEESDQDGAKQLLSDLSLLALTVGRFRQFLGSFCVHILGFSTEEMQHFLQSIQPQSHLFGSKQLITSTTSSKSSEPSTSPVPSSNDASRPVRTHQWIDLFAQSCRLLLRLSSFPLLIQHTRSKSADTAGEWDELMQLFCGDLLPDSPSDNPTLPEWLICLMYAAAEVDVFDLKSVALYTLLELISASVSVSGWDSDGPNEGLPPSSDHTDTVETGKIRMILPVLSSRLLTHVSRRTNLFSRLGISLWSYLASSQSPYHEDAANLLVRLHQLSPLQNTDYPGSLNIATSRPASATVGSTLESFILSQMLSPDLRVQVDAQARFALLWHLIRSSPSVSNSTVVGGGGGSDDSSTTATHDLQASVSSKMSRGFANLIAAPCWRRLGLSFGDINQETDLLQSRSSVTRQQNIPFYRCALLLLDNLDVDSPWGPIGSVGMTGYSSPTTHHHDSVNHTRANSFVAGHLPDLLDLPPSPEVQPTGLVRSILREQAIEWLQRALRTGQVARLLAPILAALLHPATVRVSLKARVVREHSETIRLQQKSKSPVMEEDDDGSRDNAVDFAVSSGEDNDSQGSSISGTGTKQSDVFSTSRNPIDVSAALESKLRSLTSGAKNPSNHARKLYEARRKLHAEKLHEVLTLPIGIPTPQNSHRPPVDIRSLSGGVKGDYATTMLPLHEHVVIHLQNHDANQVVYALSRLRAILTVAPTLFIRAVATCSVATVASDSPQAAPSSISLFGLSLGELLTRHRRALSGGNFYGPTTPTEVNHTLDTVETTLLDVLINTCLLVMCSQLPFSTDASPPSPSTGAHGAYRTRYEFSENEFRANKCAQQTAAEVLELIVQELVKIQGQSLWGISFLGESGNQKPASSRNPSATTKTNGQVGEASSFMNPRLQRTRRLIETTIQRTCLTSAVLHCLASAVEVAHWSIHPVTSSPLTPSTLSANCARDRSLPMCLRLLLVNQLSANLPAAFHNSHLRALVRLTQTVLQLQPWSADRIEATPPKSLMPNTIWPCEQAPSRVSSSLMTSHNSRYNVTDSPDELVAKAPEHLLKIWFDAFAGLPDRLTAEPLFKTACLSTHWTSTSTQSSHPSREQGALLLDVLQLALSAPSHYSSEVDDRLSIIARQDLHSTWYHFVFASLASWGLYTPHLTRVVVTQICDNLTVLTEKAWPLDTTAASNDASPWLEDVPLSDTYANLPPNYTLTALACLQGVYHALLLPGGSAITAALLRRQPVTTSTNTSAASGSASHVTQTTMAPTAAQLTGLPDSVDNVSRVAELIADLNSQNQQHRLVVSGTVVEPASSSTTLKSDNPSSALSMSMMNGTVSFSPSSVEPSVILTSGVNGGTGVDNKSSDTQAYAAIFTSRAKDLFNRSSSPIPDAHPLIQAQTEIFRLLPTLLSSLALIWDVSNRIPSRAGCTMDDFDDLDIRSYSSQTLPIPLAQLPCLTALGNPILLRPAIRMFIEPLALQHPASFLTNMALAWPTNLLHCDVSDQSAASACGQSHYLLGLLTASKIESNRGLGDASPIPLLPMQTSLLRFLYGFAQDGTHFGLILPATTLINQLRDLVRRPWTVISRKASPSVSTATTSTTPRTAMASASSARDLRESSDPVHPSRDRQYKQSSLMPTLRLQTNLLHMLYAWLTEYPRSLPSELLLTLLRDLINIPVNLSITSGPASGQSNGVQSSSVPPVVVFLLVKIFNIFLNLNPLSDDKREQRELQELCHRLLESTAMIAASTLEQPTWFRRTLQVRQTDELDISTGSSQPKPMGSITPSASPHASVPWMEDHMMHAGLVTSYSATNLHASDEFSTGTETFAGAEHQRHVRTSVIESNLGEGSKTVQPFLPGEPIRKTIRNDMSIQAMELLAEHMASFLDVVYRSEEKDRVPTFLSGLLANIFPYLRVRMLSNSERFTAASKLLASVSSYQYTRRAWRREALDLFFETVFFQMGSVAMQSWNIVVDNLMTQDKNTFREVLVRLTFSQTNALNLFANKEAEHDLRAACLKKISYLVYASESDQYAKSMPDLLERLTDCLRLGQGIIPQVHAQVFVFSRALIARMTAVQLTSLWPIIIPELMMVFTYLSHKLKKGLEKSKQKTKGDKVLINHTQNEMLMYLSAFKFLATGMLIPEQRAPQFSFYQWIFVGDTNPVNSTESSKPCFVPFTVELTNLIQETQSDRSRPNCLKKPSTPSGSSSLHHGCLHVLALNGLASLMELMPFLHSLGTQTNADALDSNPSLPDGPVMDVFLEAALAQEFPEPITPR